jgi:uncharacterized protein (DUF58 family)
MLPADYLKRLRTIEVRSRLVSEQLMAGQSLSVFKGRGLDFADVREYVPGDDVRRIDWNVTARLRKPFVKRHHEERELCVVLLVDLSASGHFGTTSQTKRELAAEIAGALAFTAVRDSDRVGMLLFTDQVERYVPPRKSRQHVMQMLHTLLFHEPKSHGTSLVRALNFLNNVIHRPAVVIVLSDFHDRDFERALKSTNQRHELIALQLTDRRERELPDVGLASLNDPETGETLEIDTSDPAVRTAWDRLHSQRQSELNDFFRRSRIGSFEIQTGDTYAHKLRGFFEQHAKRRIA